MVLGWSMGHQFWGAQRLQWDAHRGKHLYQAHIAMIALVPAKGLGNAEVPLLDEPETGNSWVLYGAAGQNHPGMGLGLCSATLTGAATSLISQLGESEAQSDEVAEETK